MLFSYFRHCISLYSVKCRFFHSIYSEEGDVMSLVLAGNSYLFVAVMHAAPEGMTKI